MDFFRTIIWFIYFFGYMIVHLPALKRGEKALAAGDAETVRTIVNHHVPHWCGNLLKLAGVTVTVEGRENIPQGVPCVFVANHRSYYDIALMLTGLDAPHALVSKQEVSKIPLVNRWMALLHCVYVQRDDVRASVAALNNAARLVKEGECVSIFPEGTRFKGAEGDIGEFKAGAFRIAVKGGAPVVPVAIRNSRDIMENNHMLMHPTHVTMRILPPISLEGMDKQAQKELPALVQSLIQANLSDAKPENDPYHRVYTENHSFAQLAKQAQNTEE